ncbi:MAG: hypothetical protein JXR83_16750 [Deltaproteobacteria bacterium]|nr:hypothetical protein [Deltaproteobacteria bacterium]
MFGSIWRVSTIAAAVVALLVAAAAGLQLARAQIHQTPQAGQAEGDFTIVDTPQATLLLDRKSGNLWRVGYTEIAGVRYWFGTYVPREPPQSFADFQNRLRKEIRGTSREGQP